MADPEKTVEEMSVEELRARRDHLFQKMEAVSESTEDHNHLLKLHSAVIVELRKKEAMG